jgi:pre-mRNA-splicing factor SYF1
MCPRTHTCTDPSPGDLAQARAVFDRATQSGFRTVDDLASVWCEYVEMEVRNK